VIFLFTAAMVVLLWPWFGYPLLALATAQLRPRPPQRCVLWSPRVSVVIAARDEEAHLWDKLVSLAGGGIPADHLEIIVVDDGSRDDTARIARAAGARVISFPEGRGKAAALNAGVAAARHPILVLTDARQLLERGALAELCAALADPTVGAVSGELVGAAQGAGSAYRRFDDALRRWESRSGSMIGVVGAFWACRRELYPTLPDGLILDDVYAPMMVARSGLRVVAEPRARAAERATAVFAPAERRRRVRTLAGNVQLLTRAPWLLVPWKNPLWWRFLAHKISRLLGPLALVLVIGSLASLASTGPIFAALAVGATFALALAVLGRRAGAPGMMARGFLEAQLLVALAWREVLLGRTDRVWRPVPPLPDSSRTGHDRQR
jgi:cellulose synthase/poly-beta-1,6-N-acetylglucosamine synthase-like glycosyltransferase